MRFHCVSVSLRLPSRASLARVLSPQGRVHPRRRAVELDLDGLRELPDDEIRSRLTALPGIGEWTVDWFLARHLARPRAWPSGDLGLRKAVAAF